jgi:hypothetical protein
MDDDDAKPAVSEKIAAPLASSEKAATAVAQPAEAARKPARSAKEEKKGGGGVIIVLGALVAAGAIAAGGVFYVKRAHREQAPVAAATNADKAPDKLAKAGGTGSAAPGTSVAQADDVEVDTADPNAAQTGGNRPPRFKFHAKPGTTAGGATTAEATATGGIDPKLIANIPTGPAGGSGDLTEAMKNAAGGGMGLAQGTAGTQGTANNAGNVPQRPSQGQVSGAVGNVLPTARACLGSDDPVSHASVVLQSDGTVKSVSVSGFATGKPAEACIKAALQKMTVSPFAEATYNVPTMTIRPM